MILKNQKIASIAYHGANLLSTERSWVQCSTVVPDARCLSKSVIAKEIKSCTYCCVKLILQVPWPQTGITHQHAQLGLSDKGRAIKGLVVCYVVWLGSMIYRIGLRTIAMGVILSLVVVRIAIELKYRNSPQNHTDKVLFCSCAKLAVSLQ